MRLTRAFAADQLGGTQTTLTYFGLTGESGSRGINTVLYTD